MKEDAIRLIEQVRRDAGGAFASGLAHIGDRLGLYRTMADIGRASATGIAAAAGLHERYVLEWLRAMAAFGYVSHDPDADAWWLDEAQEAVLADESSPFFAVGTFQFAGASLQHTDRLIEAFREGGGIPYEELGDEIPESIDRMHRPWFEHLLVQRWIPDIPGLPDRLEEGAVVLDVGCGLGRSTVAVARAWPQCRVVGIDPHAPSVSAARGLAAAEEAGNAEFLSIPLRELPEHERFDLALAIDCIHDMADPVGALRTIRAHLADDGLLVWSEPTGSPDPLDNTDPLPRLRAALSPYHCLTVSLAAGGPGLGTLIGTETAEKLAREAGFPSFEVLPVDSDTQVFFGLRG